MRTSPIAEEFGQQLASELRRRSAKVAFYELPLFRALRDSIISLSGRFRIEEFHGGNHQVRFKGKGSWGRTAARCEISDLLVVTYFRRSDLRIRMTFLQAKRSRKKLDRLCDEMPSFHSQLKFSANLEQWDLLSRRPKVTGVSPFAPPPNVLSGALLPSVGSFGVFHKDGAQPGVNFFYASADVLRPLGHPKSKHSTLNTKSTKMIRVSNGLPEVALACCPCTFGSNLYLGYVGTPIDYSHIVSPSDEQYRSEARDWLGRVLASQVASAEHDVPYTRQLIRMLEASPDQHRYTASPCSIIVINNEEEIEEE